MPTIKDKGNQPDANEWSKLCSFLVTSGFRQLDIKAVIGNSIGGKSRSEIGNSIGGKSRSEIANKLRVWLSKKQ